MPGITLEWCAYCNLEVKIPSGKVSDCPVCGKEIYPCSECKEALKNCNWTAKYGCSQYPKRRF